MRRLLAVLIMIFLAAALLPWALSPHTEDEAVVAPVPPASAESDLALPPLDSLTETVARPLFVATRRPLPIPGFQATEDTLVLGRYRLRGVVIMPAKRLVLLAPDGGGRLMQLAEGDTVDGWTVERIAPDLLTLRSGDMLEQVPLGEATQK